LTVNVMPPSTVACSVTVVCTVASACPVCPFAEPIANHADNGKDVATNPPLQFSPFDPLIPNRPVTTYRYINLFLLNLKDGVRPLASDEALPASAPGRRVLQERLRLQPRLRHHPLPVLAAGAMLSASGSLPLHARLERALGG